MKLNQLSVLCLGILLLLLSAPEIYAAKKAPNWKLLILYKEVGVGAINYKKHSYELAWVRRDANEKAFVKQVKEAKKQEYSGKKSKLYMRTTTTNSNKWVVIFEYHLMDKMWQGPPKRQRSLTMRKGKDLTKIREQWAKHAEKNKYFDTKIVKVINMQSAKEFLNSELNTANPYYGATPQGGVDNPCETDDKSEACRQFRKEKPVGIGSRG